MHCIAITTPKMAVKINTLIDITFLTSHYIQVEQLKKIESDEKVYSESC